jgi:hypothetical protein
MTLKHIGRFWQFIGVALLSHAATRHSMDWGRPNGGGEGDGTVEGSWTRLLMAAFIAIAMFWTGVYLESRATRKTDDHAA